MKKLTYILLTIILTALLVSCGGPKGTPFPVNLIEANPNDPASVVQAFFAARSAFNTDVALSYLTEDSQIVSREASSTGLAAAQKFIQKRVDKNYQFELSNVKASGNSVTFDFKVFQNGKSVQEGTGEAQVKDGKILVLNLQ